MPQITVHKKAHRVKSYTRSDGTRVKAHLRKASTFKIKDVGSKGKKSQSGKQSWIKRKGKLGGPGYLSKPSSQRHYLLDKCVRGHGHGYRSCLGSIMVLERSSVLKQRYGKKLASDRKYLKNKFGSI